MNEEQYTRLLQLILQREGLFALGHLEIMTKLEITPKQSQQYFEIMQEFPKKLQLLLKEAQQGGKPEEIQPKLRKARKEQEQRIEAFLTDAQKKLWKEMVGKPLDLGD